MLRKVEILFNRQQFLLFRGVMLHPFFPFKRVIKLFFNANVPDNVYQKNVTHIPF
jgi:hypothetical protein